MRTPLLAARVLASNVGRPAFPYKLNLALTYRCNGRCLLCGMWRRPPEPELTLGELETFFRVAGRFSWVDLTGGEVLLREDFVPIVAALLRHCRGLALLHFVTNGLLPERAEEVVREVVALGPPRLVVTVSVDGPRAAHERLRGVAGGFDLALRTYRALRAVRGCSVYLGMTLSPENVHLVAATLAAVREELPEVRAADLHLNLAHAVPHYYGGSPPGPFDREGLAAALGLALRARAGGLPTPLGWLEGQYLRRVGAYLATGRSPLPCRALAASCFVSPGGAVHPCVSFDRTLGSLRDHGFALDRIWGARGTRELAARIRRGDCPGCWTPCEAYLAIAGNLVRTLLPARARAGRGAGSGSA